MKALLHTLLSRHSPHDQQHGSRVTAENTQRTWPASSHPADQRQNRASSWGLAEPGALPVLLQLPPQSKTSASSIESLKVPFIVLLPRELNMTLTAMERHGREATGMEGWGRGRGKWLPLSLHTGTRVTRGTNY